jgi:sugar O-acyltransferase (sialic acid O-acetyltransferase NeuD family)
MKRALIGGGGHADEVESQIGEKFLRFVSDRFFKNDANTLPLSKFNPEYFEVMIAIGDSKKRFEVIKELPSETKFFTFIHPTALLFDKNIKIGKGSFIGAYSILTTNIEIGEHSILNRSVHIGHDCNIEDFFSAMPGSIVSGNVIIGKNFYLGTNSSIREKIKICDDVIVGLNSGVVDNIDKPGTYVGVPAKRLI